MELANYIETAMKSILKNPIYEVLSEISDIQKNIIYNILLNFRT